MLLAVPNFLPALPFCHVTLNTQKPRSSAYPKELRTLGDHIRKQRLDQGLFQKQVAERMGTSEDTIYRWERNESKPQIQFIPAIINFLAYNPLSPPESPCERLVFYRQINGLSQRSLAKQIGIDPKALGLCENGK